MKLFDLSTERSKGILALVILAFVFATTGIYARYLQADFALFQQIYLRVLGAVLLGIILFWNHIEFNKLSSISRRDWIVFLYRGSAFAVAVVFFTLAFITTKFSNASFSAALPLLPILGYFLLGEKINLKKVVLISVGFLGVALIAIHDFSHIFEWGRGELYAVLSAVAFDLSYIGRKWHSDYLNDRESTVLIFFIEGVLIFLSSLVVGESLPPLASFSIPTIVIIGISSLTNLANLFLINYGFKRVEAYVAGNILTLEVFFALLFGIFLYHEIPILREVIGGVLIIWSVYQMNRLENKA